MSTQTLPQASPPAAVWPEREGFLAGLCAGRFRWDVIHTFPKQDAADRRVGDAVLAELVEFLTTHVDPDQIEVSGSMPDGLLDELQTRGYLALRQGSELGGLGLSVANTFRVIEAAMSWAVPVGWCLAIQNGLGAGAYLPLLSPGPLRDLIERRVSEGAVFSDADTEPSGASNDARTTTATPTDDGAAYMINGEKIFIGNGTAADFLVVSATVDEPGGDVEYFFLDTSTPGFSVRSAQEFMGLRGAAIGALIFDNVRVPREQMLMLPEDVDTEFEVNRPARMYIVSAPALAIAKLCGAVVPRVRQPPCHRRPAARRVRRDPAHRGRDPGRHVRHREHRGVVPAGGVARGPGRLPARAERGQEHHLGRSPGASSTARCRCSAARVSRRHAARLRAERSHCPSSGPCATPAPSGSRVVSTSCSTSTSATPWCCPAYGQRMILPRRLPGSTGPTRFPLATLAMCDSSRPRSPPSRQPAAAC